MKEKATKTRKSKSSNSEAKNGAEKPATKSIVQQMKDDVAYEKKTGVSVITMKARPRTVNAEAYRWLMDHQALPDIGYQPIRYLGWKGVIQEAFDIQGELDLADVRVCVFVEPDMSVCYNDGITFRGTIYAPYVSQDAERAMRQEKKRLAEVVDLMFYGGSFLQHDDVSGGEIFPASGTIFGPELDNKKKDNGEPNYCGSPLIIGAKRYGKLLGKAMHWGEPLAKINARLQRRLNGLTEYQRRVETANEKFKLDTTTRRQGLSQVVSTLKLRLNTESNGA